MNNIKWELIKEEILNDVKLRYLVCMIKDLQIEVKQLRKIESKFNGVKGEVVWLKSLVKDLIGSEV